MRAYGGTGMGLFVSAALGLSAVLGTGLAHADDRAAALALLEALSHAPQDANLKKQPGSVSQLAATDDAVTRARDALERGTRMRVAGDEAHARLAEGLALAWAEDARDRAEARRVEATTRETEVAVVDLTARVERERALLEEAIARSGRLRAELALARAKSGTVNVREHTSNAARSDVTPKRKPPHLAKGARTSGMAPTQTDQDGAGRGADAPAEGGR